MNSNIPSPLGSKQVEPTLQALRYYYQKLAADYEYVVSYANSQLEHIEGLLQGGTSSKPSKGTEKKVETATEKVAKSPKSQSAKVKEQPKAKSAPAPVSQSALMKESSKRGSLKFLKPYQGFTLTAAIEQILRENRGKIMTADSVVQVLYGDLKPNFFRVAKERVTKNLSKGKIEGRWERVPDQLGCYTISR